MPKATRSARGSVHDRFDLDRWLKAFPASREDPEESVDRVTSPVDATRLVQIRREVLGGDRPDLGLPVDIMVFCLGEPERRAVTKLGGLPFRARGKPWPKRKGVDLTFLGQLCFADSHDIVGDDLPGDVLLVFGDPDNMLGREARFHSEWVSMKEAKGGLVEAREIPSSEDTAHAILPCYGQVWRTFDYPTSADLFSHLRGRLAVSEATKIGGTPFLIQADEEPPSDIYLGVLASVQPTPDVPYPWANVPKAIPLDELYALSYFQVGDMGSLYVWMDEYGKVKIKSDCY